MKSPSILYRTFDEFCYDGKGEDDLVGHSGEVGRSQPLFVSKAYRVNQDAAYCI